MKPTFCFSLLLVAALSGCSSNPGPNTTRGAAIGATAGAIIGGVIGHQSGETGAGVAIGAAAGGVAGGAYGNRQDERQASGERSYSAADYQALLTPDEVAILQERARASGRVNYELTDFLTEQEKANLRARAERNRTIGN
ncbi:hypothetical protein K0B96_05880 [Horticoccus luteus]|uniref:YMGG-like Gly-zipper domain-containing protein n=1 Tax=Horticoccus luteus TaxID=2862869 RepID=A0A8F9TXP2_9BACT|nr:glycine zipper domain-containing protein [Horticoccus luteus]QYM80143.1 hypothetical protein K0B96_05880 [Horticoccus luteus]